MTFVHLHNHSYYSLMDGFNSPEELVLRAKELNQPAIAFTDHGGISAWREAQKAGQKHGVKVILGIEAYISPTDRFDKSAGADKSVQAYHHIILLAMNDTGMKNIMRMSEIAWTEGYYFKPRIDKEVLEEYNEGVIVLSGCMSGLIAKNLLKDNKEAAHRWAQWFSDVFGDRFYMELQFHNEPGLNDQLIAVANKYNIALVATSDCHFARPEERAAEEAMLILSTSPKKREGFKYEDTRNMRGFFERINYIYPERPISFEHIDVYVSTREELEAGFEASGLPYRGDLYDNTLVIADRVEGYSFYEAEDLLPRPKNRDPYDILSARARKGMDDMGFTGLVDYEERFDFEMDAIRTKGIESYMLIVGETLAWAREQGIRIGPGRGSGAGSLIAKVTGITFPDPIKENLLFTRFVNPGFVHDYTPRFEVVDGERTATPGGGIRLDVIRGNLHEPFLDNPDYQTLLGAIDGTRIFDKSSLEDELYVVGRGGTSSVFLGLLDSGALHTNPDHSQLAYVLGISDIKPPCEPELDFDRGRTEAADFDIDVQDTRRGELIQHVVNKFGYVAAIATFNTFKDKGVIRDAARVFQVPLNEVDKALKNISPSPGQDFIDDFVKSREGGMFNRKYPDVVKLAKQLRGKIRGRGMHAAGIVISNRPITDFAPIESAKVEGTDVRQPMVALDKDQVEEIGLIKMDFLGLTSLSIIEETLVLIREEKGVEIDLESLTFDDPLVYQMLSEGKTKGVFQCDAAPYTKLIKDMGGVQEFNDLVASNALVRPGAFNTIGKEYILCKTGGKRAKAKHEDMSEFTKDTYFQILYQEQVMQTLVAMGGFSEAEADKIRKIIGKKKDVGAFEQYKDKFVRNASEKIPSRSAEKLWKDFEAHAGYSFNKSHAVAYSMISYWTAWLKYYYPQEFIVANLRHEGDIASRTEFMIEAKRMGIEIRMPHVNKSGVGYTIEGTDAIRIGLSDIKYVSEPAALKLIERRPYGSYDHLYKVVTERGNGLTTRTLHGMNMIGAAEFADNPLRGKEDKNMYEYLGFPSFGDLDWPEYITDQTSPLSEFDPEKPLLFKGMVQNIRTGAGWTLVDFVDDSAKVGVFADESMGLNKGDIYLVLVANNRVAQAVRLEDLDDADVLKLYLNNSDFGELEEEQFFVLSFQPRKTKAGKTMAHALLVNRYRELVSAMVFPQNYPKAKLYMKEGSLVSAGLAQTDDGSNYVGDIRVR